MSEEIVKKLLSNKKKMIFESVDLPSDEDKELLLDTDETPGTSEEELISRLVKDEDMPTEEVEEDTAVEYEPCVCGSTKVAMEDGHAVCDECGRELTIRELGEPLVPRIRYEEVEESTESNDKSNQLKAVLAVWNQGKYQRAMELCRRYGISDREFAFALVKSFRESDELEDEEDISEDTELIAPNREDKLGKNIIRAIHTPMTTTDRPNLDSAIMEAMKGKSHRN